MTTHEWTICPWCHEAIDVEAKFGGRKRLFLTCVKCGGKIVVRPWLLYVTKFGVEP